MSFYERVQKLIQEQGFTIKQLERECELANATIRRWETQTPNIESVRKVADRLNVSLDYLVNGEERSISAQSRFEVYCDGEPLNEVEVDLIAMFRLLSTKEREISFDFVSGLYEKATGEKTSVYSTYADTSSQQESDPENDRKSGHGIA